MGACGCSDGTGDYRLPSPPDRVLTLSIYLGCSYCDAGVAVDIQSFDLERAEAFGLMELPEVDLGEHGMWGHEIISSKAFGDAIQKHIAPDYSEWGDRETFDAMADMVTNTKGRKK